MYTKIYQQINKIFLLQIRNLKLIVKENNKYPTPTPINDIEDHKYTQSSWWNWK